MVGSDDRTCPNHDSNTNTSKIASGGTINDQMTNGRGDDDGEGGDDDNEYDDNDDNNHDEGDSCIESGGISDDLDLDALDDMFSAMEDNLAASAATASDQAERLLDMVRPINKA